MEVPRYFYCFKEAIKINTGDDRFYTLIMLAYALQQERRKHLTQKRTTTNNQSLLDKLIIRPAKRPNSWD